MYSLSPYRWLILAFVLIAYMLTAVLRMSPTVMADALIREFHVSGTFIGALAAGYFYPYAFMQIPSGLFADRFSPRKLLSLTLICASIGTCLFALAPHANIAFTGRLLIGFSASLVLIPSYKALANWFTAKIFVVIMSVVIAFASGFGAALAGVPLASFIALLGWRTATLIIGGICFFLALLIYFFFKDSPKDMNLPLPEEKKEKIQEQRSVKDSLLFVLKKRNYWFLSIGFFVNGAIYFSFSALWAGKFYTDVCGLSRNQMGTLLSVSSFISIITPVLFVSLVSKVGSYKKMLLIYSLLVFGLMLWLLLRFEIWGLYEVFTWGISFTSVLSLPPALFLNSIRQIVPDNISGTATGLLYTMPMLGSAIFQPFIGWIVDKAGFIDFLEPSMFYSTSVLYLITASIGLVAIFFLKEENSQLLSV